MINCTRRLIDYPELLMQKCKKTNRSGIFAKLDLLGDNVYTPRKFLEDIEAVQRTGKRGS